ncbi:hypothetical protein E1A91_D06G088300v1 [Gossypium mustelinum]|uniref:Uncharacterized protein n=2 Tax=Gossypium TaxID=3633 RepID=A0A5D2UFZ7_GOSMU|nr:hypothetical protein ES332_D06G095200v1 [Gossypium tomentosum]TYI76619.1 hypothetical protein E1A91_D06G088300v1 [Gossypium mustelinum]
MVIIPNGATVVKEKKEIDDKGGEERSGGQRSKKKKEGAAVTVVIEITLFLVKVISSSLVSHDSIIGLRLTYQVYAFSAKDLENSLNFKSSSNPTTPSVSTNFIKCSWASPNLPLNCLNLEPM